MRKHKENPKRGAFYKISDQTLPQYSSPGRQGKAGCCHDWGGLNAGRPWLAPGPDKGQQWENRWNLNEVCSILNCYV